MLNTFLACTGFSPTAAAVRPVHAHAPSAERCATSRSIPAVAMLAKRKAAGVPASSFRRLPLPLAGSPATRHRVLCTGGKAEVAYTLTLTLTFTLTLALALARPSPSPSPNQVYVAHQAARPMSRTRCSSPTDRTCGALMTRSPPFAAAASA
eukprot:scaffold18370_cov49-Phaeocystis_antarctica.AAC.2